MSANGTSIEEEFEVVKLIENNTPFSMLLGKPWIDKDQARRKEEEVLEQNKQELKNFMARRIAHLIEEQENQGKLFQTRDLNVKVGRTLEDHKRLKYLFQIQMKYYLSFLGKNLNNAKLLCQKKIRIGMEKGITRRSSLEKRIES